MSIVSFSNPTAAPLPALPEWTPAAMFTDPNPATPDGAWYKIDQPAEIYAGANHLSYTESFDAVYWQVYNYTNVTDTQLAPFGGSLAHKIIPNNGLFFPIVYLDNPVKTLQPNGPRTASVYARPGGWNYMYMAAEVVGYDVNIGACFDLSNGLITNIDPRVHEAKMEFVADGFWRCSITIAESDTDFATNELHGITIYPRLVSDDASEPVMGDGVNGIYIWGAQLEASLTATAYDPVLGAWEAEYVADHIADVSCFQETTGITPVSGSLQPYGLILDQRFGLARGPEKSAETPVLGGATGWSVVGNTIVKDITAPANNEVVVSVTAPEAGKTYHIKFTASNLSGATGFFSFGGTTESALSRRIDTARDYSLFIKATDNQNFVLSPYEGTDYAYTLSNLSVREVPGHHASQSTSTQRPIAPADGFRLMSTAGTFDQLILIDQNLPYMEMFVNTTHGHYKSRVQGYTALSLNDCTEMVCKTAFTAEEELELADYFGTPRVFGVQRWNWTGATTAMSPFMEVTGAGDVELIIKGANGVTVNKTYNGNFGSPNYSADGLTAPMTMIWPAMLIRNPNLVTLMYSWNTNVMAGAFPDLAGMTSLDKFEVFAYRMAAAVPYLGDSPLLTWYGDYESAHTLSWTGGNYDLILNKSNNAGFRYILMGQGSQNLVLPTLRASGAMIEVNNKPTLTYYYVSYGFYTGVTPTFDGCPALTDITIRWPEPNYVELPNLTLPAKPTGIVPVGPFPVVLRLRTTCLALTGNIPYLGGNTAMHTFHCHDNQITGYVGGGVTATLGWFSAHINNLSEAAVNLILADLVAANRTTGQRIVSLQGGTNAAPTGQGLTDKATLQSRGWTVTTN